jgi:hypothetical protein
MNNTLSRRALINKALLAAALVPAFGLSTTSRAAALVPLDPNDPMAKNLSYTPSTTKVDGAKFPTHKNEQQCKNCAQYQGKASDAQGGCNLFAGKSVPSEGWCKVWAKKP